MDSRPIALLLPGQGAQHPGMALELYGREPVFTEVMDEFFGYLGDSGAVLRDCWLAADDTVHQGIRAQSLLFGIGYALGTTLRARKLRPVVLLGHSAGELAAAALAGVYDLRAAARIMSARAHSLRLAPPGGMLAVAATPEVVLSHVRPEWMAAGVAIGARNAPKQTVLAGPEYELARTENALRSAGVVVMRMNAAEPWHSPVMAQAAAEFERAVAAERLCPPVPSIVSGRTGRWVTPAEAVQPGFWAWQMAEPVLFWPALNALLDGGEFTLAEAGPAAGLSTVARKHPAVRAGRSRVVPLLPAPGKPVLPFWESALGVLADTPGAEREPSYGA